MNVRRGHWFIEDVFNKKNKFVDWLRSTHGKRLVVLEVGVGFNTPSVLRWPMEQTVHANKNARLIRINREHPEVPSEIERQSFGVSGDAAAAIGRICELYFDTH